MVTPLVFIYYLLKIYCIYVKPLFTLQVNKTKMFIHYQMFECCFIKTYLYLI